MSDEKYIDDLHSIHGSQLAQLQSRLAECDEEIVKGLHSALHDYEIMCQQKDAIIARLVEVLKKVRIWNDAQQGWYKDTLPCDIADDIYDAIANSPSAETKKEIPSG